MNTESIIQKLDTLDNFNWENWTLDEKKKLLNIYYIISKKEEYIFDLIYTYHECDSWEDIFRDYDPNFLTDKAVGVKIAIDRIE